jgi:hypothetical protein
VNLIAKENESRTISDLGNSSGLDRCESHPVEVSGWDVNMRFFVELTNAEESEPGVKTVALHNRICNDALVFVRLLGAPVGAPAPDSGCPVAHQALFFRQAQNGVSTVALIELRSGKRS